MDFQGEPLLANQDNRMTPECETAVTHVRGDVQRPFRKRVGLSPRILTLEKEKPYLATWVGETGPCLAPSCAN